MMLGGVKEVVVRQVADRAAVVVGGEHQVTEGGLMELLLDQAEGVAALDRVGRGRPGGGTRELAERDPGSQAAGIPVHDEGRDDRLVAAGRDPQEVDHRDLSLGGLPEPDVVVRGRVGAHEGVVQLILAGEDLPVHLALIVVPDPPAAPGQDGADA